MKKVFLSFYKRRFLLRPKMALAMQPMGNSAT